MIKPFDSKELIARVRAVLRRFRLNSQRLLPVKNVLLTRI